ncbi:prefoldin subunit alpha [Candidatus Woesearchaeota archaeon]|nr:prefoldin subunit alpha [Candidatus Woesearchaeota archaeon]
MSENNQMQHKYMEFQMLMQQLQQLEQNSENIEKHINDLMKLNENLDVISNTKKDTESLIPLGNGIFLKGSLNDNQSVVMNVGSNLCVEKSLHEAKQTVNIQMQEVSDFMIQLKTEINNTRNKLMQLQKEIQGMN